MRLFFHRLGSRLRSVLGAASTIAQIRQEMAYISENVGNLVHLEAPAKIFAYDKNQFERFALQARRIDDAAVRKNIDNAFDGVVLGYANIIRNYAEVRPEVREQFLTICDFETEWLNSSKIPVFALGVGMQDTLPAERSSIDPRLFNLLKALNDRAAIFGVRGHATEAWLHRIGLTNARALGCPSLFVYPYNVLSVSSPSISETSRLSTAGRLQRNPKDPARLSTINEIGRAFRTSYVFQTDFFRFFQGHRNDEIYNEATGEVSRSAVMEIARKQLGMELTFQDYFWFRNVEKWRGFASRHDAFFGDRFHGGVVFLQTGRPALLVSNDDRVTELAQFYDLPAVAKRELAAGNPREVLSDSLSPDRIVRFKNRYIERLTNFYEACTNAGLRFFNDGQFRTVINGKAAA
jgi:hypothetical protein